MGGGVGAAGLSPRRRTGARPTGVPAWPAPRPRRRRTDGQRTDGCLTATAAPPAPAPRPGPAAHLARNLVQRVVLRRQPLAVGEPLAPRALGAHVCRPRRPLRCGTVAPAAHAPLGPAGPRSAPPSAAASWRQRARVGDAGTRGRGGQGLGAPVGGARELGLRGQQGRGDAPKRGPGSRVHWDSGGQGRGRWGLGAPGRRGTVSMQMAGGLGWLGVGAAGARRARTTGSVGGNWGWGREVTPERRDTGTRTPATRGDNKGWGCEWGVGTGVRGCWGTVSVEAAADLGWLGVGGAWA